MRFIESNKCPLCGSQNTKLHAIVGYEKEKIEIENVDDIPYLICDCGMIFQMWMMTPETIFEYYNGPYRRFLGDEKVSQYNIDEQLNRANKVINFVGDEINPKSVLDIGSSMGLILKILKEKYNCKVIGVEICEKFREYSHKIGIKTVESIKELKTKFDLITIFQTLEHLTEPMEMLKNIRRRLTKDGILLIEVPLMNYRLAHPMVFTEATFVNMLNKSGFIIEKSIANEKNILAKAYYDPEFGMWKSAP